MSAEETRELILDVALKQFARHGFSAASIRSICKEVGIHESTIYYHFKNKQAILHSLVAEFQATGEELGKLLALRLEFSAPAKIRDQDFIEIGRKYYLDFLNRERSLLLIRMLMIEQQNSPVLGKLFGRLLFEQPVTLQTQYFEMLTAGGYFKNLPARELATAYQSIIYFCFSRQLAMGAHALQAVQELERHLQFFLDQYRKEAHPFTQQGEGPPFQP